LVREAAARLRASDGDAYTYAKAAFEFVRDTIPHSYDAGDARVAWRASDVLEQSTGICFAKAHALTALLRAEGIPAALCYQRLDVVHGFVAAKLRGGRTGCGRIRGNKPGIDAQFSLDTERLTYVVDVESNGMDYPVIYAEPSPVALRACGPHRTGRRSGSTSPPNCEAFPS
jgi:hypothetical protein